MAQNNKVTRDANMDFLRIVSMLLIILLHSIDHSGVLEAAPSSGIQSFFTVRFLYMLTQVCVNLYVMLSGYFLIQSKFRLQKLVALWMEVVFYSLCIKLIFMIRGRIPFSTLALCSCFFPILTGRYWFITIYVGMYLLFPFLNLAITAMNKKRHLMLNIALVILFSAWNSIYPSIAGMNSGGGWGLAWFVVLYFLAAWFRLYYRPTGEAVRYAAVWLGFSALISFLFCFPGEKSSILKAVIGNWYHYNSFPVYLTTVALFVCFLNVRIQNEVVSAVITGIAPYTLGVYLIHAHANLSPYLWEVLKLPERMRDKGFLLVQLASVAAIFVACILIDALRDKTIGRAERSVFINTMSRNLERRIGFLLNKI